MKIAFFVPQFPKLSETFILNQVTGLIDRGHHVDVFAMRPSNELAVHEDVEKYKLSDRTHYLEIPSRTIERVMTGVRLIYSNLKKHPQIVLRSLNILRYRRRALSLYFLHLVVPFLKNYDVIHCHFGPIGNLGASLKDLGIHAKLITTFHGFDIRLGLQKGGHTYHALFHKGDCFIAISDYNYNKLTNFGLDERKIVRLPVGIDMSMFPYKSPSESHEAGTSIRILTVARLVEEKGLQYGIQAIHRLLKQQPQLNLKYCIIGDGPLKEDLTNLTNKLMLNEVVHFLGPHEQSGVIEMLQQSDIFLLPSVAEVLPVCLMEAQAVGLPVIATEVGDTGHIVLDGKSGFVVKSTNVGALAEKLKYLCEHRQRWSDMGLAGRKNVVRRYDINKLNDRLVEIYANLLNGRKPPK
ncbi:MAG: glycosyltransferase [Deltaproteobacteria bacterium]|nr:glycosyltransferase [Deltaproteobacteria bacterium]